MIYYRFLSEYVYFIFLQANYIVCASAVCNVGDFTMTCAIAPRLAQLLGLPNELTSLCCDKNLETCPSIFSIDDYCTACTKCQTYVSNANTQFDLACDLYELLC